MSYKWHNTFWSIIPVLASTYGSGSYSTGVYNGAAAGQVTIGPITLPITLPITGATLAALGAVLIAAAAGLAAWVILHRQQKNKKNKLSDNNSGILKA